MKITVSKPLVPDIIWYQEKRKYENATLATNELIRIGIEAAKKNE